jgi:hypothetical protein
VEKSRRGEIRNIQLKLIFENWNKFLKEELTHYSMEVQIKAEADTQLYGSLFNKIRGIEGITIIKSTSRMQKDASENKFISMNIKFLADPALPQSTFLQAFKDKMKSLRDAEGDRILNIRIIKLPEIM